MRAPVARDLSQLPTYAFGSRMTMAWGTAAYIALEGTGFALAAAAYLYFAVVNPTWPLGVGPPPLFWSSLLTLSLLVSVWPNHLAKRHARAENLPLVRRDLIVMSIAGISGN